MTILMVMVEQRVSAMEHSYSAADLGFSKSESHFIRLLTNYFEYFVTVENRMEPMATAKLRKGSQRAALTRNQRYKL
jgi:hypothetical protein